VELTHRPIPREAAEERCPYCHDQLAAQVLAKIECPGCQTTHHRICIQELGRCSVYGCEHPLDPGSDDGTCLDDSPIRRVVRQRMRDRARRFAESRRRDLPERILESLQQAQADEANHRYAEAERGFHEVEYLLRLAREDGVTLPEEWRERMSLGEAKARARAMVQRRHERYARRLFWGLLLSGGVPIVVWILVMAFD
jgi:hypothetical protein